MKQTLKKAFAYLATGFLLLFLARLVYGYLSPDAQPDVLTGRSVMSAAIMTNVGDRTEGFLKQNIASEKLKVQRSDHAESINVDQKYEKVASLESQSKAFDDDEKSIRALTGKYSGLIQFEQSSGLIGARHLDLGIGVPPDRFDDAVYELKTIGELASIKIDKTDKTNEYKTLKAKRASLERTRDSLVSLKAKSGRIDEFTNLENRMLEIDQEIQTTGVQLGDYDQENEFCTVKLSLFEKRAAAPGISFRHRVVVALAWAIRYYALLLGALVCGALLTLILVVILQRLNMIPARVMPSAAAA